MQGASHRGLGPPGARMPLLQARERREKLAGMRATIDAQLKGAAEFATATEAKHVALAGALAAEMGARETRRLAEDAKWEAERVVRAEAVTAADARRRAEAKRMRAVDDELREKAVEYYSTVEMRRKRSALKCQADLAARAAVHNAHQVGLNHKSTGVDSGNRARWVRISEVKDLHRLVWLVLEQIDADHRNLKFTGLTQNLGQL